MKALSALKSTFIYKGIVVIILFSLLSVIYPELVFASTLETSRETKTLVFEVKNPTQNSQNNNSITFAEIVENDPLTKDLTEYLESLNSPLAIYAPEIIQQPQWQRALAISWVESNMCIHHVDNNCSGIGVAPGHALWREYDTHLDWFKDMSALMEKPIYKERFTTFQAMRGVYVQPGSDNWVYGAQSKFNKLIEITENADAERKLAAAKAPLIAALATFPELAYLD